MYLILLGPPGTGKGTQAAILARRFGWSHISTGDMLREAVAAGTELGKTAKGFMDAGALVPDEVVIGMLVERLGQPDAARGFILDGFPRNLAQAEALDDALADAGKGIDLAFNIDAPDEELVRRLSGRWVCPTCGAIYHAVANPPRQAGVCDNDATALIQRDDDKPETVRARLERQRPPTDLIAYYHDDDLLYTVDGTQPIDVVTAVIVGAIEQWLRVHGGEA